MRDGTCKTDVISHRVEVIKMHYIELTQAQSDRLAAALGTDGSLPALRALSVIGDLAPGGISKLTRALARGTVPLLRDLSLYSWDTGFVPVENILDLVADMLEERVRNPRCKRLELFNVGYDWLSLGSLAARSRMLQVLLPSVVELPLLSWNQAYEPFFLEVHAPFLKSISLDYGGNAFSWKVLEATPALREIWAADASDLDGGILQSISTAMRHGALRSLEKAGAL